MNSDIEVLIVDFCVCNDESCTALDLSSYVSLRVFEVGDECFRHVNEVKLIGLKELERVVIGKNCFTKKKNRAGNDPNRHFYLVIVHSMIVLVPCLRVNSLKRE